jgi:rhodanese-related sulfurtransferase
MKDAQGNGQPGTSKPDLAVLRELEPVRALPDERLAELAELCLVERVSKTLDPFRVQGVTGQLVFLLEGELALTSRDGRAEVVVGGTGEARHPLGRKTPFAFAKAITDIVLLRIDDDLLDIMVTWHQLADLDKAATPDSSVNASDFVTPSTGNWALLSGVFSIHNLKTGAFAQLPAAHINELLKRFVRIAVARREVIVRAGDEGDFYYVIETGKCMVERVVGGVSMKLAELKSGDAFGEEALVANAKRNATVTMLTDGALLRLAKEDFNELLKKPLLHSVSLKEASDKAAAGAQWIDVRYPSEYQYDKLPGAINIPLAEIRNAVKVLEPSRQYLLYCQSGRRSSAAAFLLAQRGFNAYVLDGGLRNGENAVTKEA